MPTVTWTLISRDPRLSRAAPAFGAVLSGDVLRLPVEVADALRPYDIRTAEQLLTFARMYGGDLAESLRCRPEEFRQAMTELSAVLGDRAEPEPPPSYHGGGVRPPKR